VTGAKMGAMVAMIRPGRWAEIHFVRFVQNRRQFVRFVRFAHVSARSSSVHFSCKITTLAILAGLAPDVGYVLLMKGQISIGCGLEVPS